jgi:chorismate mutase
MTQDIQPLRDAIDAIDDQIIALLNARSELVRKVGRIKQVTQKEAGSYIRAGREAVMARNIWRKFLETGPFPAAAAVQIWRLIIAASLSLESSLRLSAAGGEVYWRAREYLGPFTPAKICAQTREALGDAARDAAVIAAVALPSDAENWWVDFPETLKIFACAPFLLPKDADAACLLAARLTPEATGEDRSLYRLPENISPPMGRPLAQANGARLWEVEGFHPWRDWGQAFWLGTYASPIRMD